MGSSERPEQRAASEESGRSGAVLQLADRSPRRGALEVAVSRAVAESLELVGDLQGSVDEALTAIEGVVVRARAGTGSDESANEVVEAFWKHLRAARAEAAELFERQCQVLGTVNIVLFGRTGAGKSSLIEALVQGDGSRISTGESDFTKDVEPVNWHGCRFIDTPGTNGWGNAVSRETLETRTRGAVEVADVVVLCFDTQGQQRGEFEKIGAWVKEYGKPVVAVFNVRNQQWRRPYNLPLRSQRRRVSQSVREHVSNIETELAALGIFSAPVVAISAQRAAYARVPPAAEWRGPVEQLAQFSKLREETGPDRLLKDSNFEVLEALFVEVLEHHVKELRFGMLHAQVRTLLVRLSRVLEESAEQAKTAAEILDGTVEGLFKVVGYPTKGTAVRKCLELEEDGDDLLSLVERARGGPYGTKARGKLARFARQRLESELGALRARSLAAAEEAVAQAFDERRDLDPKAFSRKVFRRNKIHAACERVAKEATEFVRRETQLVLDDATLDLNFAFGAPPMVAATTGKTDRRVGYGLGGATVALGAASAWLMKLSLAAVEVPPVAAGLALGSLVAGIGSMVTGWFGGKKRKEAEKARHRAWADAVASARRNVNDRYDSFAQQVSDTVSATALDATSRLLTAPLSCAFALWTLVTESTTSLENLTRLQAALPVSTDAQGAVKQAASAVGARLHGGHDGGLVFELLGESWIDDPEGLQADEGSAEPVRTPAYDPSVFRRLFEGFRSFIDSFGESIEIGSGLRWLRATEQALAEDTSALLRLAELATLAERGRARVQLFGDYSAGKTSFVKRLLIDSGLHVPESVEVRGDPTTDDTFVYEWEHVDLVDTPGLQSMKDSPGEVAMEAYPDASAVIYLLQPNLLVGDTRGIERVLKGDGAAGLVPKINRTIFVIHRADELGADPETVPNEYVRLCERKKAELQQALLSRGITISADRVFCMSADPYQLVGNRRDVNSDQFDRFRSWDGFAEFRKTIRELNALHAGSVVDRLILEGGSARLGALDESARKRLDKARESAAALNRLGVVLAEIVAEGERIDAEQRARARRLVEDHAFGQLERVAGAASDAEVQATAKQLSKWWTLPAFETDAARWQHDAKAVIDDWFQRSAEQLERVVTAPRFKAALAGAEHDFDPVSLAAAKPGWLGRIMNFVAQPLKGATRDVVYWVKHAFGGKFKPWGAHNLSRSLGRIGVVFAAIAAVLDAYYLTVAWKGEKRRAKVRKELREIVEDTAKQVLDALTDGNDEAAGPTAYLAAVQHYLRSIEQDLEAERSALTTEIEELERRRAVYGSCIAEAWRLLGFEETTT